MVRVEEVDGKKVLVLSEHEYSKAGLDSEKELELSRADKGTWLLKEKESGKEEKEEKSKLDKAIFGKLEKKPLNKLVEGRFEKSLEKKELKRFKELLEEGKIIRFKLSDKYKKAIYKIRGEQKKRKKQGNIKAESPIVKDLEEKGYMQLKNELRAKKISQILKEDIEAGRILGIRGFDERFNIIRTDVYKKHRTPMLRLLEAAGQLSLEKLSGFMGVEDDLARAVIEFLKEEGEVIEKRRNLFEIVP